MNPLEYALLRVIGLAVAVAAAVFVLRDANALRDRGVRLTPVAWAGLTFCACGLALPMYLVLRFTIWQRQANLRERGEPGELAAGRGPELGLTCDCGRWMSVYEGQAGLAVQCKCGRTLQVPSLGKLRRMAADG
jgi:hypothetical protein